VIRNYLKGVLPAEQIKQAYIPDMDGKERRKRRPGKEGKLGVEGMPPEVLLESLRRAGATFFGGNSHPSAAITKAELLEKGLIGPGSVRRRKAFLQKLNLPAHLTSNAMLEAMNLLLTREEWEAIS
jgi:ribonuclease M5